MLPPGDTPACIAKYFQYGELDGFLLEAKGNHDIIQGRRHCLYPSSEGDVYEYENRDDMAPAYACI